MFGLDITERRVKILELQERKGTLILQGLGEKELEDINQLPSVLKTIRQNAKPASITSKEVVLAIPEEESFTKYLHVPLQDKSALPEFIQGEIQKILPYEQADVYWDWKLVEPSAAGILEVMVTAAPRSTVDQYIQQIKDAGCTPALIETESNALLWGVASPFCEEVIKEPTVIVNMGDEKSTLVIVTRGTIRFSASLPMNGIKKAPDYLALPWDAWIQSNKKNWSLTEKNLLALLEKMREDLDYYHDHLLDSPQKEEERVKKVVITGSWANFPEIVEFISKKIGMPALKVQPLINVHPAYTIALGLALRGLYEEQHSGV